MSTPTHHARAVRTDLLSPLPWQEALLLLCSLLALHQTVRYSFLLFHSLAELFSIVIAIAVALITLNTQRWIRNQYVLFIGLAYGFIGFLDTLHTMSYAGMGVFRDYDYYAPQVWISARYLESLSVGLGLWLLGSKRRLHVPAVLGGYALVCALLVASIFVWKIFPVCFVKGAGLTPFKIVSEYIIIAIMVGDLLLLHRRRALFEANVFRLVQWGLLAMIGMEICFTQYASDAMTDLSNQLGHLFKITTFYLVYKAIVVTGLRDPMAVMFAELRATEDALRVAKDRAERGLKSEQLQLAAIVTSSQDAIFGTDAEGRITSWNAAAARLFGIEEDAALGQPLARLLPEFWSDEKTRLDIARYSGARSLFFDTSCKRPDGEPLEVAVSVSRLGTEEESESGWSHIVRDIGPQKTTERALLSEKKRLETILETASDGIHILNNKGFVVDANAAFLTMLGYQRKDIGTLHVTDIDNNDDPARIQQRLSELIGKQSFAVWETRHRRRDGSVVDVEISASGIDIDGEGFLYAASRDITQRKRAEQALRNSEDRLRRLLDAAPIAVRVATHEGRSVEFANDAYRKLIQADSAHLLGTDPVRYYANPDDYHDILRALAAGEGVNNRLLEMRTPDGTNKWVMASFHMMEYEGEQSVLGWMYDVTALKAAELRQRLTASVFTHAREGISITDAQGNIVEVNATFCDITGYTRDEIIGKNPRLFQSGRQTHDFYRTLWESLLRDGHWSGELWNRRKNGDIYACLLSIAAVRDENGELLHYVSVFSDITQYKQHQSQLEHVAHYDGLTNLPNRVLLSDRLRIALARAQRAQRPVAVVYLDLDGFKAVNDQHGHAVGDALLVVLAQRMQAALRAGDTLSRVGGDEFVAVLADLDKPEACEPIISRLLQAASEPAHIEGQRLQISASIGVTLFPLDGGDADQLLRHADQAMYEAKQGGKNRYHMFDPEKDALVKANQTKLKRLEEAYAKHELVLYYQPKVDLRDGHVFGAEALIRWQHPEDGLLAPVVFLPVLEDTPLEAQVGEWVIDSALGQAAAWQAQGISLIVSVNVSARFLLSEDFIERLSAVLARHPDVPPAHLELEILETAALDDMNRAEKVMRAAKALGVQFALDDFGTGYSSLAYFRSLPIDMLKIDQSFVRNMLHDSNDRNIVQGVISLAQTFNRPVIAEGVETLDHGARLLEMGCALCQGYGIGRPMDPAQFPAWLADWRQTQRWLGLLAD
ncbi:MASE3 domain-containing protein [Massilia sp. TS11]|uniref:bifunctional diguanylate cyclase/phosphodiesterase n=1 Tax=Massilia sp. TS11 TaxID=2908003 RepID=UPI001EDB44BD|nr:MASE3 domain-containing protein [Massilia sp. TS11]MCG2584755.1 PAS domain S-box protein [Massilia sp. TS11]